MVLPGRGEGLGKRHRGGRREVAQAFPSRSGGRDGSFANCICSVAPTADHCTSRVAAIGDAAHAMSPIGGIGINLAIQDAVAAANILAEPLATGRDVDTLLGCVQHRRMLPTRVIQGAQKFAQDRIIGRLLAAAEPIVKARLIVRRSPASRLRRFRCFIGLGLRPSTSVLTPSSRRTESPLISISDWPDRLEELLVCHPSARPIICEPWSSACSTVSSADSLMVSRTSSPRSGRRLAAN